MGITQSLIKLLIQEQNEVPKEKNKILFPKFIIIHLRKGSENGNKCSIKDNL